MSGANSFITKVLWEIFGDLAANVGGERLEEIWRHFNLSEKDLQIALNKAIEQAIGSLTLGIKGSKWLYRRSQREYAIHFEEKILVPFFVASKVKVPEEFKKELLVDLRLIKKKYHEMMPVNLEENNIYRLICSLEQVNQNDDFDDYIREKVASIAGKKRPLTMLLAYYPALSQGIVYHFQAILKSDSRVAAIFEHYSSKSNRIHLKEIKDYLEIFSEVGYNIEEILTRMVEMEKISDRLERNLDRQDKMLNRFDQMLGQDYYLLDEIYRSGSNNIKICRAYNRKMKRIVALKIMEPGGWRDDYRRYRFNREARSLGTLSAHPNIIDVYNAGILADECYYIEMEYFKGSHLDEWGRFHAGDMSTLLRILQQISSALKHAHDNKIVHRDLKPENMLVNREGLAKVIDFGIAKWLDSGTLSVTREGTILGTFDYMAPEQLDKTLGEIGPWTDIYSFGIICYEIFSGKFPFRKGESPARRLECKVNPLQNIPEELSMMVMKMLAPKISNRFTEMEEIISLLQKYQQSANPLYAQLEESERMRVNLEKSVQMRLAKLVSALKNLENTNKNLEDEVKILRRKLEQYDELYKQQAPSPKQEKPENWSVFGYQVNPDSTEINIPADWGGSFPFDNPSDLFSNVRYRIYDSGIVLDTKTNLEWRLGPDRPTTWYEAQQWAESLTNGNGAIWRLPTRAELSELYEDGIGNRNIDPAFKTNGWYVWSGEAKNDQAKWLFCYGYGGVDWNPPNMRGSSYRAMAVRIKGK